MSQNNDSPDLPSGPATPPPPSADDLLGAQSPTVQLCLPPFWSKNPRTWFYQVEAQFQLHRISTQLSRYYHTVSNLPLDVLNELDDLLAVSPPEDAYDNLKEAILRRTSESESCRLRHLLNTEKLGDRQPTQLLHRMRQLLGDRSSATNDGLLRELFLQRLPPGIRMILAPAEEVSLDNLAEMADRIAEHAVPTLSSLAAATPVPHDSDTEAKIEELTAAIHALQDSDCSRWRARRCNTPPSRFSSLCQSPRSPSSTQQSDACWYHHRFGADARNCHSPCRWQGNARASR